MSDSAELSGLNVVMLVGELSSEPVVRRLASGDDVTSLEVTTPIDAGRMSVPVSVIGDASANLHTGSHVVVRGHIRRRFFSAGSSVGSRTEVVATRVVPLRRNATVSKTFVTAQEDLQAWLDG